MRNAYLILRFGSVGLFVFLINYFCVWLFYGVFTLDYRVAITIAFIIATIFHFILNRIFTYRAHGACIIKHLWKYGVMLAINYMIYFAVTVMTVKLFGLSPYLSIIFATGFAMISSFFLMKYFVFLNSISFNNNKTKTVWPKIITKFTDEQKKISDDFMHYWHETLANARKYKIIENFNHGYVVKASKKRHFSTTLEIGAGLGEHLLYEQLTAHQRKNYTAVEIRENMANSLKMKFNDINVHVGDCQNRLPFPDGYFDRILAIHVLGHLTNLPACLQEIYRLCNREHGCFYVVIPCEGGLAYSLARKISAQRIFEKKYKQPYKWLIQNEHINMPTEIIFELEQFFKIVSREFFPLKIPIISMNLCIGLTLIPKKM
jgi:putative flippase GtrA/2-polyprenyl-3-methyl-5-hydroxy-6-metoxy-1,4-benzoquinol methylase